MGIWHEVQSGECLSTIAKANRLPWKKIWDHGENAALKEKRGNPDILYPGDKLFIPDLEERDEQGGTEQRHRFKTPKPKLVVEIILYDNDHKPLSQVDYHYTVDGEDKPAAKTGGDGIARVDITETTASVVLHLPWGAFPVDLGVLDPANTIRGIQQRLVNLGIETGPIDGILGPKTRGGILTFQRLEKAAGLDPTGEPDDKTIKRLRQVHEKEDLGAAREKLDETAPAEDQAEEVEPDVARLSAADLDALDALLCPSDVEDDELADQSVDWGVVESEGEEEPDVTIEGDDDAGR